MSDKVTKSLVLEFFQASPYVDEEGVWEEINRWSQYNTWAVDAEAILAQAKAEAKVASETYKHVRLVVHTVTRTITDEEVDFSE
jgi:hypothetical protein